MAVNRLAGDNARKGAVRKRSQVRSTLDGASAWTKRSKASRVRTAAKKFKGVRAEKKVTRR